MNSFSSALLFSLLSVATAFAPSAKTSPTTSLAALNVDKFVGIYENLDDKNVKNLPGDQGFDPLNLADYGGLFFQREAEIKHCRLAMLSAAGWPIAELLDRPIAAALNQNVLVDATNRSPSLLNGGLAKISPVYWAAILTVASLIDIYQINKANQDPSYTCGDLGFDPLGLYPKDEAGRLRMQTSEIKNGRLAMIAIAAFAAQEYVSQMGVVNETPFFFKPFMGLF